VSAELPNSDLRDQWHTRNAKFARPSVRPGSGWYLVPAFATKASVVVGPAKSLLANLTPFASPDWYWKDPEAGAASPRCWAGSTARRWTARCAPRQALDRDSIVKRAPCCGAGGGGGKAMDGWSWGELIDVKFDQAYEKLHNLSLRAAHWAGGGGEKCRRRRPPPAVISCGSRLAHSPGPSNNSSDSRRLHVSAPNPHLYWISGTYLVGLPWLMFKERLQ
jgi:hypothetical protein